MSTLTASQFATNLLPLRPALVRYAAIQCGSERAIDLYADMRALALVSLHQYDADTGQAGLLRWLMRILRLRCLEAERERIESQELLFADADLIHLADHQPQPMEEGDWDARHEYLSRMRRADLTERQRTCAQLYLEGYTQRQIAEVLCVSQRAICYHLAAAFSKMRAVDADEVDPRFETWFWMECCRVTIYHAPNAVWDRRGTVADRERRRSRLLKVGKTNKLS